MKRFKNLKTMLLGMAVILGVSFSPIRAKAAAETNLPSSESDISQENAETGGTTELNVETVDPAESMDDAQRPKNHMQCRAWITDSSGRMVNILGAEQTYTAHLRVSIVGDTDAEGATAYIINSLYEKQTIPGYSTEYHCDYKLVYCATADNIGADCADIIVKSATADALSVQYVSNTAKLQIPGITDLIDVDEVDLFTSPGVILGESARDGHLSVGGSECELTFDIETKYFNATATATASVKPDAGASSNTDSNGTTYNQDGNGPTGHVPSSEQSAGATSVSVETSRGLSTNDKLMLALIVVVCSVIGGLMALAVKGVWNRLLQKFKRH